jgi:hypothetical protein
MDHLLWQTVTYNRGVHLTFQAEPIIHFIHTAAPFGEGGLSKLRPLAAAIRSNRGVKSSVRDVKHTVNRFVMVHLWTWDNAETIIW